MSTPLSRLTCSGRKGFVFLEVALGFAIALATFLRLRGFDDPPGQNGYFYLKQTHTVAENFTWYFSDHSFAFLPLALLKRITGNDLLSFQIGIGITLALLCWGICFLLERAPGGMAEKFTLKALALTALFSSSFFGEFSLNFFKNLLAATLLIWCGGFLLREKRWAALAIFCLAFFTHKSVSLVGGAYLAIYLGERIWRFAVERKGRRAALLQILAVSSAGLAFCLLFLLFFPNASAFVRFASENFTGPGGRIRWVLGLKPARALELAAWVWILALLLIRMRTFSASVRQLFLAVLLVSLIALQPFQKSGEAMLGYRLVLLLPLLLLPLAVFAGAGAGWRWRIAGIFPLVLAGAAGFAPLGLSPPMLARQVHPLSRMRADVEKIAAIVKPDDYLISHHGLEFFVDYVTGIRSRSFLPEPGSPGRKFRLAYVSPKWDLEEPSRDEIEQVRLLEVGTKYVLLEEADWSALSNEHRFPSSWRNPKRRKPAHVYAD